MAQESLARSHFEVTCFRKLGDEVTSRSRGLRKLGSKSLPGHLAQEKWARIHFEVTWLDEIRLGVTSGSPGLRKLRSKLLRGHLASDNSARGHFKATWLKKPRLEVPSRSRQLKETGLREAFPDAVSESKSSEKTGRDKSISKVGTSLTGVTVTSNT